MTTLLSRKEAESIVRKVIATHAGEPMEENLFKNSVDKLLLEANGEEETEAQHGN